MTETPLAALAVEDKASEEEVADKDDPQAELRLQEKWQSLDEVYDEVKDAIDAQRDRAKSIDTKANFGLTAATLLTAGVTGLGRALAQTGQDVAAAETLWGWDIHIDRLVDWVSVASLAIYAAIVFCTYRAYGLKEFRISPYPPKLTEKYVHQDPRVTKATITGERVKNYVYNQKVIHNKTTWITISMNLLVADAVLLIVIAVLQAQWL